MTDLLSFCEQKPSASCNINVDDSNHEGGIVRNESQLNSFTSSSSGFGGYRPSHGLLSPIAHCLQMNTEESPVSSQCSPPNQTTDDGIHLMGIDSKDEIRKSVISAMDQVFYSMRVPSVIVHKFEEEAMRGIRELGTRLLNYKTQLIQEMEALVLQEHLDTARGSVFEFACEQDACYMPCVPRKKNGLDY